MLTWLLSISVAATAATPASPNPLQPIAFLAGSCWAGDFPNGVGVDTHCFEWVYDGKFVRDRHVLRGKKPDYSGETLYAWMPEQKQIAFWYWSSDGDVEQGVVQAVADGLEFPEHHLTAPKDMTMRARWRRLDADRYEAVEEQKDGEQWKTMWKVEYRRQAAAPKS